MPTTAGGLDLLDQRLIILIVVHQVDMRRIHD